MNFSSFKHPFSKASWQERQKAYVLFVITDLVLVGTRAPIFENFMTNETQITIFYVICDDRFGFSQNPSTHQRKLHDEWGENHYI